MKDKINCSTAPQSRDRLVELGKTLPADHAKMLRIWLDHWWAEVVYDIDTVAATLTDDVYYRMYGAETFTSDLDLTGKPDAIAMYKSLMDAGLMPGGPFDNERLTFAPWGLMMEAHFTCVFTGEMLPGIGVPVDPAGLYKVQWPMVVVHPIDLAQGALKAEIMYAGKPIGFEPTDRATIALMLGKG